MPDGVEPEVSSSYWDNRARFKQLQESIDRFRYLQAGWDSYGTEAPNQASIRGAIQILKSLEAESFPPNRIRPSAEGGIAISFANDRRRGDFEVYNTGEVVASVYRTDQPTSADVWEIDPKGTGILAAAQKIREYLS